MENFVVFVVKSNDHYKFLTGKYHYFNLMFIKALIKCIHIRGPTLLANTVNQLESMLLLPESYKACTADVKDEVNVKILPCLVTANQNLSKYFV